MATTVFFVALLIITNSAFDEADPVWLQSPFFRANNEAVIATRTGSDQTPAYTFTFLTPLSGIPTIAYGIKGYEGTLYLMQATIFWVRRIGKF